MTDLERRGAELARASRASAQQLDADVKRLQQVGRRGCRLWYAVDDSVPMAERTCRYCGAGPEAHS